MIRWFRRRRPAPPPQPEPPSLLDAITMTAWGITPQDWNGMTDQQRAWRRMNVTKAPHFPH